MVGTMDESPRYAGRFLYDTEGDVVLDDGAPKRLRFVAFQLPGGKEEAELFLREQGLKSFSSRMKSIGKFYCEKDAEEAFRKAVGSIYGGVFTADPKIYLDRRLRRIDPDGPCWRAKGEDPHILEDAMEKAAEAYSIRVIATNIPYRRNDTGDIRNGATADEIVDSYQGQYRVERCFAMMKSGMGVGRLYVHSPARQDAIVFLSSVATMVHGTIDTALAHTDRKGDPNVNPYEDGAKGAVLTMKHISDFMSNVYVKRDDATGSIVISGYPGAAAEVQDILDRLQLDPNLLLGY